MFSAQSCLTLRLHGACHTPCLSLSPSFLKLMPIESVIPSNHLILCHPLLLLSSVFPSIRVFSSESARRIWSFSVSISPSNEHPGQIFRMDWLDLLAVLGPPADSCLKQLQTFNGMGPREASVQLCRVNRTVGTAGHTVPFSSH